MIVSFSTSMMSPNTTVRHSYGAIHMNQNSTHDESIALSGSRYHVVKSTMDIFQHRSSRNQYLAIGACGRGFTGQHGVGSEQGLWATYGICVFILQIHIRYKPTLSLAQLCHAARLQASLPGLYVCRLDAFSSCVAHADKTLLNL
jgi:hypothetical protein